jgi:uncharacterized membrane protein YecN with MAPEG domain
MKGIIKKVFLVILLLIIMAISVSAIKYDKKIRITGGALGVGIEIGIDPDPNRLPTYWKAVRTDYWSDTRVALWSTARNTELP